MYACYQSTIGGSPLVTRGGGMFGLTAAQSQRQPVGIDYYVFSGLAAGTYTIGMCGSAFAPANWNNNEWGYVSALVF